jgi:hypothetical protein
VPASEVRDTLQHPLHELRKRALVPLHGDFNSFSPHGEERGHGPRVSKHGRTCGAARAASFETAGKSRPPQDEEVIAQPVKITVSRYGTSPGDIPLNQVTRYELALNLTAKSLGLEFPATLLGSADFVVE